MRPDEGIGNGESEKEGEDENGTSEENATTEGADENSTGNGGSEETDTEEEGDETDETDEEGDETAEVEHASLDRELAELNVANVSPNEEYIVLRSTGDDHSISLDITCGMAPMGRSIED